MKKPSPIEKKVMKTISKNPAVKTTAWFELEDGGSCLLGLTPDGAAVEGFLVVKNKIGKFPSEKLQAVWDFLSQYLLHACDSKKKQDHN